MLIPGAKKKVPERWYTITPEWSGETCVIIASGPSAAFEDFDLIRQNRLKVITINLSYQLYPETDIVYFCDARFWRHYRCQILNECAAKIVTMNNPLLEGVFSLRQHDNAHGLSDDPGALCPGGNSGYQAIGLARHLGVRRILLIGYDMRTVDGKSRWHGPYPWDVTADYRRANHWIPSFATLARPLRQAGIQIVNCTPGSAIPYFPAGSLSSECTKAGPHLPVARPLSQHGGMYYL